MRMPALPRNRNEADKKTIFQRLSRRFSQKWFAKKPFFKVPPRKNQ